MSLQTGKPIAAPAEAAASVLLRCHTSQLAHDSCSRHQLQMPARLLKPQPRKKVCCCCYQTGAVKCRNENYFVSHLGRQLTVLCCSAAEEKSFLKKQLDAATGEIVKIEKNDKTHKTHDFAHKVW